MSDETNKVGEVSNKVGDVAEVEGTKEKKSGRQPFDVVAFGAAIENAVDGDGLLTIVPDTVFAEDGVTVTVAGYDERKNKPLKKENFLTEAVYTRYCAMVSNQKSEWHAAKAVDLLAKAKRIEQFGSEDARKAANKLAKAQKQMIKLRATLKATGMTDEQLDDILAGATA